MSYSALYAKMKQSAWLSGLAAVAGALAYLFQLLYFASSQESVLDEGAYLYKGYLFATGQYSLYQPYGPWSNHMPLAFLIPGAAQWIFGAGIRTGRYFAVFLAMLTILGIWILARRFGGRWWAAGAVLIVVLNPMLAKMYSTAISQGIVIALLTWMLVLILGSNRPQWQILCGSLLAGLIFLTRINMILVLPAAVLYIFWEHGRKAGLWSALIGASVVVIGHAVYWPEILQLWAKLPRSLTPFLNIYRLPKEYEGTWQPDTSLSGRLLSFFQTIRFHFTVMIGVITSWLLWPKPGTWKSKSQLRITLCMSCLFLVLLVMHLWASLTGDYCVFCMPGYLGFFFVIGLVILVITSGSWNRQSSKLVQSIIVLVVLIISAGIGYSTFEDLGNRLYDLPVAGQLVGSASAQTVQLGAVLVNKFGLEARELRRVLPTIFGLGSGVLVLLVAWIIFLRARAARSNLKTGYSFGYLSLLVFLVAGTLLSPSYLLSGGYNTYDCASGNVLQTYESAGKSLDAAIPAGALVYWKGTLSAVPLLYLDDIRIFPPQINDGYSYLARGEDQDLIMKLGRWNDDLARRWVQEADYILVEDRSYGGWLKDMITARGYQELPSTPLTISCRRNSFIRIFKNPQPEG